MSIGGCVCGSTNCKKYNICKRAVCEEENKQYYVTNWHDYGSGRYTDDGKIEEEWYCGERGNYAMFEPIKKEWLINMNEKILTKEEYTEKLNSIIRPIIEFAMSTKQFNDNGCYNEEFVKIGEQEVTLCVVNSDWRIVHKNVWNDMVEYKMLYHELKKENEKLKANSRKKIFGIF